MSDMELFVKRVPSELSISDLPSREEYGVLEEWGAVWCRPHLSEAFWKPDSWKALRLKPGNH